jgi:ABC-type multidrug transport system fused ATPase/permease subunit
MTCAIMVGLLDAMMPLAIKLFMDTIFEHKNLLQVLQSLPAWVSPFLIVLKPYESLLAQINLMEKAYYIPVGIVLFTMLQGIFNYTSTVANSVVRVDINQRLKQDLFSKLLNYETAWYDNSSSGEVISHFCQDSDAATSGLTDIFKNATIRFFSVAGLALTLLGLSPQLALIALGVLGTIIIPITFSRKYLKRVSKQSLDANTQLAIPYLEALQGNRVIKLFQLQSYQLDLLTKALRFVRKVSIRMAQISGILTPLMHTIAGLGIGLVLYYGSILIQYR